MSRLPGRSHVFAACGALLLLAGFAIGCGSGGEESSLPASVAGSAASDGSEAAKPEPDGTRRIREAGAEKPPSSPPVDGSGKSHDKAGSPRSHDEAESHGKEGSRDKEGDAQPQRTSRGGGSATVRAEANSCVERIDRATCAAMAEAPGNPSQSVREPADCAQVMSKSECEELARAQESARQRDESVNVEECIENPTPRCEEILRPVLEAQGVIPRGAGQ